MLHAELYSKKLKINISTTSNNIVRFFVIVDERLNYSEPYYEVAYKFYVYKLYVIFVRH